MIMLTQPKKAFTYSLADLIKRDYLELSRSIAISWVYLFVCLQVYSNCILFVLATHHWEVG